MSNTTPGPENGNATEEPTDAATVDAATVDAATADESDAAEPTVAESAAAEPAVAEPTVAESPVAEPDAVESRAAAADLTANGDTGPVTRVVPAAAPEPATASEPAVAPEPAAASEPATASEPAAASEPAVAPFVTPVYVTAPTPPKAKGNRGVGILIAVLAAIAYAVVYAAVSLGYFALNLGANAYLHQFQDYVVSWAFWVPVVVFFLMFVLLVAIVNRGGWWAYVLGGLAVAVVVYFAYIGGALLEVKAWTGTVEQADRLIAQLWVNPLMLGAAIVAREVAIWFGKWIAARGRRVRERNLDAQRTFDREVAEGPLAQRPAAGAAWSER